MKIGNCTKCKDKFNLDNHWEQFYTVHCPIKGCKGMLLQNMYCHEHKCSDCNKKFMEKTEYVEVEEK